MDTPAPTQMGRGSRVGHCRGADGLSRGAGLHARSHGIASAAGAANRHVARAHGRLDWSDAARAMLPWRFPPYWPRSSRQRSRCACFSRASGGTVITARSNSGHVGGIETPRPPHRRQSGSNGREGPPASGVDALWPAGLLLVAAAAAGFAPVKPDLSGKRIVAYDDGTLDWTTADPGNVLRRDSCRDTASCPARHQSRRGVRRLQGPPRGRPPRRRCVDRAAAGKAVRCVRGDQRYGHVNAVKIGTVSRRNARGSPPENLGLRQCGRQARCGGRAGEPRRHRRQCA